MHKCHFSKKSSSTTPFKIINPTYFTFCTNLFFIVFFFMALIIILHSLSFTDSFYCWLPFMSLQPNIREDIVLCLCCFLLYTVCLEDIKRNSEWNKVQRLFPSFCLIHLNGWWCQDKDQRKELEKSGMGLFKLKTE